MPAIEPARKVFTHNGFRYEIIFTQVEHQDYDTLLVAWRQSEASGKRSQVVLKPFPVSDEGEQRERVWEELQLATYLKHEHIATAYTVAVDSDKATYAVSENIPGMYLATALDWSLVLGRPLSPALIAFVVEKVADALDFAHTLKDTQGIPLNIIHRAVSPMRIRLGYDGRVMLTNFGAAYSDLKNRIPTPVGTLRGDAAYAAPEVWRAVTMHGSDHFDPLIAGRVDGKADVFSLGVVAVEGWLGEYALDPTDVPPAKPRLPLIAPVKTERPTWIDPGLLAERVMRFNVDELAPRLGSLPKGLRDIVCGALAADAADRITAGRMRDDLLSYLNSLNPRFTEAALGRDLRELRDRAQKAERVLAHTTERTALTARDPEEL